MCVCMCVFCILLLSNLLSTEKTGVIFQVGSHGQGFGDLT